MIAQRQALQSCSQSNMALKGARRPDAVLKVCFLIRFGGFAWLPLAARLLSLHYALKKMTGSLHETT